jgi:hypothetical protein
VFCNHETRNQKPKIESSSMPRFRLHAATPSPAGPEPPAPLVFVALGEHQVIGDHLLLTPGCSTNAEVDEWIDRLITQLNAVRRQAKDRLGDDS